MKPLRLDVRRVGWVLAIIIMALTAAHFGLGRLETAGSRLVDLDAEGGFGTWFTSAASLGAAGLALWLAVAAYRQKTSWVWWGLLALALLALSIDEVAQVHEGVSSMIGGEMRGDDGSVMAGTPIIGLLVLPFLVLAVWGISRVADGRAAMLIVAGLAIFWLAAFGIEELEYRNHIGTLLLTRGMSVETGDFLLVGIQESLEMTGVGLVIVGLLRRLQDEGEVLELEVADLRAPD